MKDIPQVMAEPSPSTATPPGAASASEEPGRTPAAHDHPPTVLYVKVAVILAMVTAIEVGMYYTSMSGYGLVAILMALAVVKFGMVVAYFMHLKFDGRLLRRLFLTGVVLAGAIYTIALITLDLLIA